MNADNTLEIDLLLIIRYIWIKKVQVSIILIGCAVIFYAISFLFTPIYQAKTILAPVESDISDSDMANKLGGLASVVGVGVSGDSDENTVNMAIFESRKFSREFIVENKLIPVIFEKDWDEVKQTWKSDEPTLWESVNYFDEQIRSLIVDKETGLITLLINLPNPEDAVKWSNIMIDRINKVLQKDFIEETQLNLSFLNEQLTLTQNSEMRTILYGLIQEEIKNSMLSNSEKEFAFKVIDPAVIPEKKSKPRRILFAVSGGLLGIIISLIYTWQAGNRATRRNTTI